MKGVPNNSHCFKHACSHRQDQECPYCATERMAAAITKKWMFEQYPHANRVTMPQFMQEIEDMNRQLAGKGGERP